MSDSSDLIVSEVLDTSRIHLFYVDDEIDDVLQRSVVFRLHTKVEPLGVEIRAYSNLYQAIRVAEDNPGLRLVLLTDNNLEKGVITEDSNPVYTGVGLINALRASQEKAETEGRETFKLETAVLLTGLPTQVERELKNVQVLDKLKDSGKRLIEILTGIINPLVASSGPTPPAFVPATLNPAVNAL